MTRGSSMNPRDPLDVFKLGFALASGEPVMGGRDGIRRGRQRDVTLAGEQPAGGVQSHPARARQINFAPGVQIGEVLRRSSGTVERFFVGRELNQVAGDEAGGQTQVPQDLHQQPRRVPARSRTALAASLPATAPLAPVRIRYLISLVESLVTPTRKSTVRIASSDRLNATANSNRWPAVQLDQKRAQARFSASPS